MLRNTAWTPVLDRLKARCQEAESEREALRAENERLRRVIDEIAPMIPCHKCPGGWGVDRPTDPCPPDGETCAERVINEVSRWALSGAGKGEHETH